MNLKISINEAGLEAKPGEGFDWAGYNASFHNVEISTLDLVDHIYRGNSFAPVFDGVRKTENFILGQHVAVDFDGGDQTIESLRRHPMVRAYASIIYPTLSHTPEHPRYRVVATLSEPVYKADGYKLAVESYTSFFPTADRACVDATRQMYGNGRIRKEGMELWFDDAAVLPIEDLRLYAKALLAARKKPAGPQVPPTPQPGGPRPTKRDEMDVDTALAQLTGIDPYGMPYDDWVKLGCAYAHTYGESAYWGFRRWSDRQGKEPLSWGKWKSWMDPHGNQAGYGTIIHYLKRWGVAA